MGDHVGKPRTHPRAVPVFHRARLGEAGSTEPTACTKPTNCPEGSTIDPDQSYFVGIVTLAMDVATFVADYQDEFAASVAEWLSVNATDVRITCMCAASCATDEGTTPEGRACGGAGAAGMASDAGSGAGAGAATARLLQTDTVAVEYLVLVGSAEEQAALEEFAGASDTAVLQQAMVNNGFAADVAASATNEVVLAPDAQAASSTPATEEDYTQVLITVMFAVPVAMLVVGLAMYQNGRKEVPVKLPGLITAVVFAFYDFFSDVWFVATPVPAEYVGFTIAAAVAVGVATLVGAGIVGYAVRRHKVVEWGAVDVVTAVQAVTNTDQLALRPWESGSDAYEGMPDATTARLPVLGVVVEDLPQLFIQGFYLITSGDTGNLVVLVSVSMSGCSLLLRFVRGAFAFIAAAEEPKLAETSPMKDWDGARMRAWLADMVAHADPSLGLDADLAALDLLTPAQLLHILDAIKASQEALLKEEEEKHDRNNYTKEDVATSALSASLALPL